jgi:hypothetical protein
MPRPNAHHVCIRVLALVVLMLMTTSVIAGPREARADGGQKSRRDHAQDDDEPTNVLLESAGSIALPGRGLSLAWSPDGATLTSTAGGPLIMLALVDVSDGPDEAVRLWRWRRVVEIRRAARSGGDGAPRGSSDRARA